MKNIYSVGTTSLLMWSDIYVKCDCTNFKASVTEDKSK